MKIYTFLIGSMDDFESQDELIDYVETEEMSAKDKVKDLDLMIEAFVEEERYEDCALLVKIKDKIKKHYRLKKLKQKIKGNE